MPAKKKRRSRKPGLLWRVLFGHNGPTKGEMKKLLGLTFSKTFDLQVRDPATGRVRKQRVRIGEDGRIQEVKTPAKKKGSTAKRPAAKKTTAGQTASQPSKTSRASKAGSTPRQRHAPAAPAPRRVRAVPLAERVLRNPDGTLAGSKPASPERQLHKAEAEYRKALRSAQSAGRRADELLGWRTPKR